MQVDLLFFYALIESTYQCIRRNLVTGTLLPNSGYEMLHLCNASGTVIPHPHEQQKQNVVADRTVTRHFQPENVRVNGYVGKSTTISAPKLLPNRVAARRIPLKSDDWCITIGLFSQQE